MRKCGEKDIRTDVGTPVMSIWLYEIIFLRITYLPVKTSFCAHDWPPNCNLQI